MDPNGWKMARILAKYFVKGNELVKKFMHVTKWAKNGWNDWHKMGVQEVFRNGIKIGPKMKLI